MAVEHDRLARKPRKDKLDRLPCRINGCEALSKHHDLCQLHYGRWHRKGLAEWVPPLTPAEAHCSVDNCQEQVVALTHGYCSLHFSRWRRKGDALWEPKPRERQNRTCSIEGCERPHNSNGLCKSHRRLQVSPRTNAERDKLGRALPEKQPAICGYCGTGFTTAKGARFCGDNCSRRAKLKVPLTRTCAECRAEYPNQGRAPSATCSPACAKTKRRRVYRECAAKRRATAEGKIAQLAANQRYIEANRDKVNDYYRWRRENDPAVAMACAMRSMLVRVLKRANKRKDASCVRLLGYNQHQLRSHIERQFVKGMGWHNRDRWHIDHIVPVAEFMRKGETDPAVVNALSNLQPLWAGDNMRKSDRLLTLV